MRLWFRKYVLLFLNPLPSKKRKKISIQSERIVKTLGEDVYLISKNNQNIIHYTFRLIVHDI